MAGERAQGFAMSSCIEFYVTTRHQAIMGGTPAGAPAWMQEAG